MATIRLRRHGPYVVEDADVTVVDWEGRTYPVDRLPVALCRCGASARKPFCDGSHARVAFDGGPSAPEPGDSVPSGGSRDRGGAGS